MRRFIILLCILLPSVMPEKLEKKHFIWSIKNEKNTIYLFGSYHVMKKNCYPLPEIFTQIYNRCDEVFFEANIIDVHLKEKIAKCATYKKGKKLQDFITPKTYQLFQKSLKKYGMTADYFQNYKPWFCGLFISMFSFQQHGFFPQYGLDTQFLVKAKADKKNISFFETNQFQIDLFDKMPQKLQEEFLLQAMENVKAISFITTELLSAWKKGNHKKLAQVISFGLKKHYPNLYKRIISERNRHWIKTIEKQKEKNHNVLIIVRAGHLVGEDSILELLKAQGYKIRQH